MQLKELLDKVKEFQVASGQLVNNKPTVLEYEDAKLRYELMYEENLEFFEADDKVEVLDSTVDQLYVLLGTINTCGMQEVVEEAFNRVHENNMTKVVDGKVIRNSAGKILKPEGFVPVDLTDLV
jgi:predicted HAD superfamily Cof-like phosphohydrolase